MQEIRQVAAAIDLRVRQLEAQGIKGPAIADHMFGYMAGLQRIYDTASDETLIDLSRRYPGFHHYASLMEALSEKNQAMMEAGTHPHGDLPVLPEPIKLSLEKLLASAAELERGYQSAVDSGRFADHINELTGLKHRWADNLQSGPSIPVIRCAAALASLGATSSQNDGRADQSARSRVTPF